jgi:hypothetical protein
MACENFSLCIVSIRALGVVFAGHLHGFGELLLGKQLVAFRFECVGHGDVRVIELVTSGVIAATSGGVHAAGVLAEILWLPRN